MSYTVINILVVGVLVIAFVMVILTLTYKLGDEKEKAEKLDFTAKNLNSLNYAYKMREEGFKKPCANAALAIFIKARMRLQSVY